MSWDLNKGSIPYIIIIIIILKLLQNQGENWTLPKYIKIKKN